jgi:hypothetical protein
VTIDTVAPGAPTITDILDDVGPIIGSVANGGTTDDDTPTLVLNFSELFGAGASLEVFLNGVGIAGTITPIDADTVRFTGSDPLTDGLYTYTARMTDAAGNVGSLSGPYSIAIQLPDLGGG